MSEINPDRPLLVGPEAPIAPFPYKITGTVVKGYGRGSRELGIPTGMCVKETDSLCSGTHSWTFVWEKPTCQMML
jgi:riboflavin kinase